MQAQALARAEAPAFDGLGSRCLPQGPSHRRVSGVRELQPKRAYDLSRSPLKLKGVKLAMNVQNLTNKTYVSQCTSDLDCYYGEGRTVVSSLTYDW